MTNSVYIHIPFCKKKCKYCSFVSFCDISLQDEYIKKLLTDITVNYKNEVIKTLYFGGGTPSLLNTDDLKIIIDKFKLDTNCEITIEVNPDDCNELYLNELRTCGINRISIGAQTFDDKILEILGRRHNSKQIIQTVKYAKKAEFNNISLDLMYGLPMQTIKRLENDLMIATSLDIQHISTYGLKIEENTDFGKNIPSNLPNDDTQADYYIKINEFLHTHEFYRYEISNFAKKGYESRHNLNYWNNNEYYGFGISAHGYQNCIRYSKPCTFKEYFNSPGLYKQNKLLSLQEQIEEEIFLGFRKSDGINIDTFFDKYNFNFELQYADILKKYMPDYIQKTHKGYCLTTNGVLLSNIILADFLM